MIQSRKGCQSLDEDTMHGNVCHLNFKERTEADKRGEESRTLVDDKRKEWEVQHSSRHIGTEWGSSKDRCWQCLPLAL